MEKKNTGTRTVCVTGGTGFLGSWLVMRLLDHGYAVNTTVRSHKEPDFLTSLPGASERLRIFQADLNQPESFRAAIEGCVGVFLVAHQMRPDEKQAPEAMAKTCVDGTLAILQACLDSKTVKRVVYTSSVGAAMFPSKYSGIIDENSWSDADVVSESMPLLAPYVASKMLTERAVLEFAGKHGLDLVSVLPTWIHGPFLTPRCPGTVCTLMSMFFGDKEQYQYISSGADLVHVDDVARAHIFLFESPDAKGRYLCSAVETTDKLSEFLRSRYPGYQIFLPPDSVTEKYKVSTERLLKAGFKYKHGLEETYDGAIECCKRLGLL